MIDSAYWGGKMDLTDQRSRLRAALSAMGEADLAVLRGVVRRLSEPSQQAILQAGSQSPGLPAKADPQAP